MESVLDRVIKQNTENVNLLKTKDYNIFSVLQIQSKEVLICRMIADLLNPRGQHGAGAEYLKIFLRDCHSLLTQCVMFQKIVFPVIVAKSRPVFL
jgi:hypothetical protein